MVNKLLIPTVVGILVIFLQNSVNDESIKQAESQIDQYKTQSNDIITSQLDLLYVDDVNELKNRIKKINSIEIEGDNEETINQVYDLIDYFDIKNMDDIIDNQEEIVSYLIDKYGYDSELIDNRDFFVEDQNYTYNDHYVLNVDKIEEYADEIENSVEEDYNENFE